MESIISLLLAHIQVLNKQIKYLLFFIAKNIPLTSKPSDWNSPKYRKLKIDKLPVIIMPPKPKKKDFKKLISQYFILHGKPLKPVKRRAIASHLHCPTCNAPSAYIYDNTGGRGQFECKVCNEH